jgi:hypothetical protein
VCDPAIATGSGGAGARAPVPFVSLREEEMVGWLLKRLLILAAPFVWRKYMERRRRKGAT